MAEPNISYKTLHEHFISNNSGTTLVEISAVLCSTAILVLLRDIVSDIFRFSNGLFFRLFLDFVFLILPLQLEFTILNENIDSFLLFTSFTVITVITVKLLTPGQNSQQLKWRDFLKQQVDERLPFVSNFRAYTLVATAISILAVDFTVYPRRFGKVETYGNGLMDCGVGLFIISNAIVAPEGRGKYSNTSIFRSSVSCLPLIFLGILRVISVKGTDYQEHVTEYGVHWNFFFTLAIVKILSLCLYELIPERFLTLSSVILISVYQYCLTSRGLSLYIINGVDGEGGRHGFLDANREGIFSSIGYLSMYLFAVKLGGFIFKKKRHTVYEWIQVDITFLVLSAVCFILMNISGIYIEPVSRRFANLTYVLLMIALGTLLLTVMLLAQIITEFYKYLNLLSEKPTKEKKKIKSDNPLCLLESVNFNGLFYFLLANLMTGLVNLSMKTIYAPTLTSFIVITIYMFSLSFVIMFLYSRKIRLKFW